MPPAGSSLDKKCSQLPEPNGTEGDFDRPTYDEFHRLRLRRGNARKDSTTELITRLPTMVAVGRKRACDKEDSEDTSEEMPATQEKRRRV